MTYATAEVREQGLKGGWHAVGTRQECVWPSYPIERLYVEALGKHISTATTSLPFLQSTPSSFSVSFSLQMGVHGLTTYLRENKRHISRTLQLPSSDDSPVQVVVDGWS